MEIQIMNPEIIDERRVNSGVDFLAKLNADNVSHQHDFIIGYLQPALDPLKVIIDKQAMDESRRSSKTQLTDEDLVAVKVAARHAFKLVDLVVGAGSVIGKEVFPHGLEDVNLLNKTNFSPILNVIISGLTAHAGIFPGEAALMINVRITYTTDRALQVGDKGNVKTDSIGQEAASLYYCKMFSNAVCDLSKLYREVTGKGISYINQSLLLPHKTHVHDHYDGINLGFGEKIMVKQREFTDITEVKLTSLTPGVKLAAAIVIAKTDAFGNKVIVNGGHYKTTKASSIGGETGTYLMVENLSLDTPGNWDIDIID